MSKVTVKGGIGFPGVVFLILLIAKLAGANITWFWVFSPLWLWLVILAGVFVIGILIAIFIAWKRRLL